MDEPGEHQLVIERVNDQEIVCELRWYDDWASWDLYPKDQYRLVHKGRNELHNFVRQIQVILEEIFLTYGEDEYRERWVEHDFPMKELEELTAA